MEHARSEQPLDTAGAVDIAQAALRLGISMQTLVTLLEHGFLKGYKGEDGRWKVMLDAAEAAAATLAVPKPEPRPVESVRPTVPERSGGVAGAGKGSGETPPRPAAQPAAQHRPALRDAFDEPPPEPPPMAETFDAPPPQSAPHQPPPHQAAARPAPQPPPYQPEARQPEPPPRAAQPAAEPVPPPMAEPARPAAGPTPSEKLLAEQVEYLRLQLDRRDKTIVEKDALIADLMQTLARLGRTAIKRIHTPGVVGEDLQDEVERNRRQQSEINERHERVLHNVSDVLASVRNHLARQRPPGGNDD